MLGELHLTIKDRAIADWQWIPHRISTENNRSDPEIAARIEKIRARFVKGGGFGPHVNPLDASVLRTPIDRHHHRVYQGPLAPLQLLGYGGRHARCYRRIFP